MGTHKLQLVMATTVTLHTRLMPRRTEWYIAIEERGLTRTERTPEMCEREQHYATYNTKDIGHGMRGQSDSRILEGTERLSFGKGGSDELEDLITQITSRAMTWSEVRKLVITRRQS